MTTEKTTPADNHISEEIDRLSAQVGRQAHELGWRARDARRLHVRALRLENAIRKHAEGRCNCPNERTCLMRLYRLVPLTPRVKRG